jgi:hypothetical protein
MHYFLLGPSGVGKTTFGNWLQDNRQYLHIPADRGDGYGGLVAERLWGLWIKLKQGDPKPFADELQARAKGKNGSVLSFPSAEFFEPKQIDNLAAYDIAVRYLYGPKEACMAEYNRRENRQVGDRIWCQWNRNYQRMGGPGLSEYRADIIEASGKRLSGEEIAGLLKIV